VTGAAACEEKVYAVTEGIRTLLAGRGRGEPKHGELVAGALTFVQC
jgi:hypothetical protein